MKILSIFRTGLIVVLCLSARSLFAQNPVLPNAYAHNDYRHKRPLYDALDNGFSYVEADIYLRGDKLIVSHILPCLKKNRTLEEMYLKPLLDYVHSNQKDSKVSRLPITLMIDIKSNGNKTYAALSLLLEKYKVILSSYENGQAYLRNVTVVITGHKPNDLVKQNTNRIVFFDEDLRQTVDDPSGNTFPIASCKYSSILKWKGKGPIAPQEKLALINYVAKAHQHGCKVRLWASPEKTAVWDELLKCNVDLINTNKLVRLRNFLIAEKLLLSKTETINSTIEIQSPAIASN